MNNISSTPTAFSAGTDVPKQSEETFLFDDPTHRLVLGLVYLIIGAVSFIGNGLVLLAVTMSKRLHTVTNVFVVNLSVSDFIGSATLPLVSATYISREFPFPESFCWTLSGIVYVTFAASLVNLTLIAINRYTLITKPRVTFDKIYTKLNITLMVILSWLYVVIVICGPPAFGVGELGYSETYMTCSINSENRYTVPYVTFRSVMFLVSCIAVTSACYVGIYRFVCKAGKMQRKLSSSSLSQINNRQLQVTKNLFIIVCFYIVCVTPYVIVYAVPALKAVLPWGSIAYTANSCINPFVYGLWHPNFSGIFRLILKCRFSEIPQKTRFLKLMCKSDPGQPKSVCYSIDSSRAMSF